MHSLLISEFTEVILQVYVLTAHEKCDIPAKAPESGRDTKSRLLRIMPRRNVPFDRKISAKFAFQTALVVTLWVAPLVVTYGLLRM